MTAFDHLETPLNEAPLFHVGAPDKRRDWSELSRQATLFRIMRHAAPSVLGFAIPNAGKRNPLQARREGIMAGVFDTCWQAPDLEAWIEMKGAGSRGTFGKLSQQQIDWGNAMTRRGKNVACFYCPVEAAMWLASLGFPVRALEAA